MSKNVKNTHLKAIGPEKDDLRPDCSCLLCVHTPKEIFPPPFEDAAKSAASWRAISVKIGKAKKFPQQAA